MATRPGPVPLTAAALGAVLLAALVALSPSERAQSLGLTQHGQTLTVQDAGAADAVAVVAINAGTPGQVYTISDVGLPHWAAASGGTSWGTTTVDPGDGTGWGGTVPAGMTATWSGGALAMSVPSGVTGTLREDYPVTLPSGTTSWDIAVRIQATTGSGTTSAAAGVYVVLGAALSRYVGINVRGDGQTDVSYNIGSGGTTTGYAASTLTIGGGQSWLRLSRSTSGVWSAWVGEGSGGALPTLWVRRWSLDNDSSASLSVVSWHLLAAGVGGAPAVDWVATVHTIRTTTAGSL